jgi:RNA polymerase sigma-70 factor (ECF subfamily)
MLDANALMDGSRDIDAEAFMAQLDRVLPTAYRLAYALLRNRDDASDIVQESTLSAWRHRRSFRRDSPIKPWFLAIVANECRQTVRSRWWSVIRRPDLSVADQGDESDLDDARSLRHALLQLNHTDRLVLVLRYYLDLSFIEVAAVLNVSAGTARVRTHRALGRLRPIMEVPEELSNE